MHAWTAWVAQYLTGENFKVLLDEFLFKMVSPLVFVS